MEPKIKIQDSKILWRALSGRDHHSGDTAQYGILSVAFAEWVTGLCDGKVKFTLPTEKQLDWATSDRRDRNNFEWCLDCNDKPNMRGGAWYNDAQSLRAAYRNYDYPSYAFNDLGFRVVVPQDS